MAMHMVKLARNSKSPPMGQRIISDDAAVQTQWLVQGFNIGCLMKENNRIVVDIDTGMDDVKEFYELNKSNCTVIVWTRRGAHFHFSGELPQTYKIKNGDLKASGHTVWSGSVVDGHRYTLTQTGELQPFPMGIVEVEQAEKSRQLTRDIVRNVRGYLAKVHSIQGHGGSKGLVRAAAICRDAGMSQSEATLELLTWNQGPTVRPAWEPREIARAITNVFKKGPR
jgi:hypothetical protein